MIARIWYGRTRAEDVDEYTRYMERTGVVHHRATAGNRASMVLRRLDGDEAEFIVLSLWDSLEAIRAFAGDDPEVACYFPEDGRFLPVYQTEGTDNKNRVFVHDLKDPRGRIEPFLNEFDAAYAVVGNDASTFYVLTNNGAPRYRLVAIPRTNPAPSNWKTLIPEAPGNDVLEGATMVNDQFVTSWMTDAHTTARLYTRAGGKGEGLGLPAIGTVSGFSGRRSHSEIPSAPPAIAEVPS